MQGDRAAVCPEGHVITRVRVVTYRKPDGRHLTRVQRAGVLPQLFLMKQGEQWPIRKVGLSGEEEEFVDIPASLGVTMVIATVELKDDWECKHFDLAVGVVSHQARE